MKPCNGSPYLYDYGIKKITENDPSMDTTFYSSSKTSSRLIKKSWTQRKKFHPDVLKPPEMGRVYGCFPLTQNADRREQLESSSYRIDGVATVKFSKTHRSHSPLAKTDYQQLSTTYSDLQSPRPHTLAQAHRSPQSLRSGVHLSPPSTAAYRPSRLLQNKNTGASIPPFHWKLDNSNESRFELYEQQRGSSPKKSVVFYPIKAKLPMEQSKYFDNQHLHNKTLKQPAYICCPSSPPKVDRSSSDFNRIEQSISKNNALTNHELKMNEFLRRIGCSSSSSNLKVFNFHSTTNEEYVRQILLSLNWVENKAKQQQQQEDSSPPQCFNLRWISTDTSTDYTRLLPNQFLNHFENNQELTNQAKLLTNINHFLGLNPQFSNYFLPQFVFTQQLQQLEQFSRSFNMFASINSFMQAVSTIRVHLTKQQVDSCIELTDEQLQMQNQQLLLHFQQQNQSELLLALNQFEVNSTMVCKQILAFPSHKQLISEKAMKILLNKKPENESFEAAVMKIVAILKLQSQLFKLYPFTNFMNYWIIKPIGDSNNHGSNFDSEEQIIHKLSSSTKHNLLVYKEIERVFIHNLDINNGYNKSKVSSLLSMKKFNIRQWVLVRSFQPLIAYRYRHAYLRMIHDGEGESESDEAGSHSNRDRNKEEECRKKQSPVCCAMSELQAIMARTYGISYESVLERPMNELIMVTLSAVQGKIKQHASCFEVYAFDIAIDKEFNPYLIEVNQCSQSLDDSDSSNDSSTFVGHLQHDMFLSTLGLLLDCTNAKTCSNWIPMIPVTRGTRTKVIARSAASTRSEGKRNTVKEEQRRAERILSAARMIQKWYRNTFYKHNNQLNRSKHS